MTTADESAFEKEKIELKNKADRFADAAFPVVLTLQYQSRPGVAYQATSKGLSKRELFAAMAMQALQTHIHMGENSNEWIVGASVDLADALIAELAKESK